MSWQRGLYAIADPAVTGGARLVTATAEAIAGGAVLVQYRGKHADPAQRRWEAEDLLSLCRPLRIPLIINDDTELAAAIGADGLHLGASDGDPAAARERLGDRAIIGVSCYNRLDLAHQAVAAGASYVAFGSCFPSTIKPDAVRADLALLQQARAELTLPICAIGGINSDNAPALLAAGVDLIAVISALYTAPSVRTAATQLAALYG